MRKLFVTDLDGTLLEKHKHITEENYSQIRNLKDFNHCFAIATGRGYDLIQFLISEYPMDVDYFVLLNGALIIDKHSRVIKHEFITFETIKAIVSEFYNEDWKMHLGTGFKSFKFGKEEGEIVNPKNFVIEDIEELSKEKLSMVGISYKKDNVKYVDEVCQEINKKFGDIITAYRNVDYIDIVPKGCSKGSGIEYIKQKETISHINTYAIGDSWNDVSMFMSVEHSFTFSKAEKELKARARYIVDSVAECIGKYVLEDVS
jgi:Cof subfamily protein (haloacid dehalogenase superfamily)